jgi:hypothetical protein
MIELRFVEIALLKVALSNEGRLQNCFRDFSWVFSVPPLDSTYVLTPDP